MKKFLYYMIPFIIIPISVLVCEFLDNRSLIKMSPYILFGVLALCSAIIGNLTPTNKNFDYTMAIIMPLSMFCTMFVGGLWDRGCSGIPRFSFNHACNVAFQAGALLMYIFMFLITFLASFKAIRITRKLNQAKSKTICSK